MELVHCFRGAVKPQCDGYAPQDPTPPKPRLVLLAAALLPLEQVPSASHVCTWGLSVPGLPPLPAAHLLALRRRISSVQEVSGTVADFLRLVVGARQGPQGPTRAQEGVP